jgi:hypothetical protein
MSKYRRRLQLLQPSREHSGFQNIKLLNFFLSGGVSWSFWILIPHSDSHPRTTVNPKKFCIVILSFNRLIFYAKCSCTYSLP